MFRKAECFKYLFVCLLLKFRKVFNCSVGSSLCTHGAALGAVMSSKNAPGELLLRKAFPSLVQPQLAVSGSQRASTDMYKSSPQPTRGRSQSLTLPTPLRLSGHTQRLLCNVSPASLPMSVWQPVQQAAARLSHPQR